MKKSPTWFDTTEQNVKINGRFLSNFVAFSQCLHFNIKLFFQLEILVKFFSENLRLGNLKWTSLIVTFPDGIPEEFILKPADFSDPEFFKNLAKATLFLKF